MVNTKLINIIGEIFEQVFFYLHKITLPVTADKAKAGA